MATLTQPENTGTLDREAVLAAARASGPQATSPITAEVLDQHASALADWLDAHGTIDEDELARRRAATGPVTHADAFPTGAPAILVHQHVWMPTPQRWDPPSVRGLDALLDDVFAPIEADASDRSSTFRVLPPRPQDARTGARNRALGWGLAIALWAVAAALLVPLAIQGAIGAIDMTVDLGGSVDDATATAAPDAG